MNLLQELWTLTRALGEPSRDCVIIGEGASGGALGIGVGDKVYMMENTWYTVISPESCSSILWRSWDKKEVAAEQLKLTADNMKNFGLVDGIVPEPAGGAHWDYVESANILKQHLLTVLEELKPVSADERISQRIVKFGKMGFWDEAPAEAPAEAPVNENGLGNVHSEPASL